MEPDPLSRLRFLVAAACALAPLVHAGTNAPAEEVPGTRTGAGRSDMNRVGPRSRWSGVFGRCAVGILVGCGSLFAAHALTLPASGRGQEANTLIVFSTSGSPYSLGN